MTKTTIHLGYEVGTGEPIAVPVDHMVITGRTQASGKTTTLEALIARSGLSAVTFVTKPGEESFIRGRRIDPYFHDQGDWRFTASVLEATLGEKLKRERAEIITASKGAKSLREVYNRIVAKKERSRSGWVVDVLTTLEAYLEIVIPQLERTRFAASVEVRSGEPSIMDLSDRNSYSPELQSLIIRSVMGWVLDKARGVVTIVPEAWKFIPEERGSPVKLGCEELIRQGGVLGNYVWIDSQDLAGVDKAIAKSCGVWVLGVQREINEVKRVIAHLPSRPRPKPEDVMQLGLGQFYVSVTGKDTKKVYVQPAWMDEATALRVAVGEIAAESVMPPKPAIITKPRRIEPTIEVTMSKPEQTDDVQRMAALIAQALKGGNSAPTAITPAPTAPAPRLQEFADDDERQYQKFKSRLLSESPALVRVLAEVPEIEVKNVRRVVEVKNTEPDGVFALMVKGGFFDEGGATSAEALKELRRLGKDVGPNVAASLAKRFAADGFLTLERNGRYKAVPTMKRNIHE